MGVEITYTLGGRKVSQKQFFEGLEGQVRQMAVDQVVERVQQVSCPQHGQKVAVSEVRETGQGFEFEFSGCCDEAIARARDSLT